MAQMQFPAFIPDAVQPQNDLTKLANTMPPSLVKDSDQKKDNKSQSTTASSKDIKKKKKPGQLSPYIVFSSERSKEIKSLNPSMTLG